MDSRIMSLQVSLVHTVSLSLSLSQLTPCSLSETMFYFKIQKNKQQITTVTARYALQARQQQVPSLDGVCAYLAARLRMYSSKDSPEAMAPFLPRELFSADTGVGSLVWALGVPPQAAS